MFVFIFHRIAALFSINHNVWSSTIHLQTSLIHIVNGILWLAKEFLLKNFPGNMFFLEGSHQILGKQHANYSHLNFLVFTGNCFICCFWNCLNSTIQIFKSSKHVKLSVPTHLDLSSSRNRICRKNQCCECKRCVLWNWK